MTIPAAPTEAGGDKVLFGVYDATGTNTPALFGSREHATLNGTEVGALDTYPLSGKAKNFGGTLSAGTQQQIMATSTPAQGVLVRASGGNTGTLYVGITGVTANEGASTSGWPLGPGESVGVPCQNLNTVYVIGTTGDKFACLASID